MLSIFKWRLFLFQKLLFFDKIFLYKTEENVIMNLNGGHDTDVELVLFLEPYVFSVSWLFSSKRDNYNTSIAESCRQIVVQND